MESITKHIESQLPGFSLRQAFYKDAAIYRRELDRIFMQSWHYAGHLSQIPAVGDYFLYDLADESVIIIRSSQDEARALLNVCRHRGSRLFTKACGWHKLLVCPYHGWTYELDGALRGGAYLSPDFNKDDYSLKALQVEIFHGMIFINFSSQPASFEPIRSDLDQCLRPYGLARARVAHQQSYRIEANWKLAVENYCECYHCNPAHPEYAEGHGRARPDEDVAELLEKVMAKGEKAGLPRHCVDKSWAAAGGLGIDRGFDRYPLLKGFVTGSKDGKPVAPLLGDIRDYDGGATDIQIGPCTFFLAYCDHVVVYHFKPLSLDTVACDIAWLVNGDAQEGKDYQVDELIWLWDVTTIADKRIIENNQKGVNSQFYQPGPYTEMESFTRGFTDWYLDVMRAA